MTATATRTRALFCLAVALGLFGCEKDEAEPSTPYEAARAAWEKADLEVEDLSPVKEGALKGALGCQSGKVSGISVLVCEFPDADAADKAQERGLKRVGDETGLSISHDRLLLVLADNDGVDKSGKSINKIGESFRSMSVPAKKAAKESQSAKGTEGQGEQGQGD